ncbi:MAG: hypothetical protein JWL87_622 [Candidatus Adlerbacteria bacterium]|nr:hypothetical protein [Candidatus Adlerbacteria bacterium]
MSDHDPDLMRPETEFSEKSPELSLLRHLLDGCQWTYTREIRKSYTKLFDEMIDKLFPIDSVT